MTTTELKQIDAYCVKCKEKRVLTDFIVKTSDSGRQMAMGNCPSCGTKCNRILGKVPVPNGAYSSGYIDPNTAKVVATYKVTLEHARFRFGWFWRVSTGDRLVGRGLAYTTLGRKHAIKSAIRRYERNRLYDEQKYSYEIPIN